MIRAMDGVRSTPRPQQVIMPARKPRPVNLPVEPMRFVVGMDGVRRQAPMRPRDVVAAMQAPAAVAAAPVAEQVMEVAAPVWQMPSLRLPQIGWKRPAIAFGLVATALVTSGAAVNVLSHSQPVTARAASASSESTPAAAVVAPTPTPAPVKAGLQELLNNFAAANPDKFGIVVKDLTTGQTASISPDRQIASASLYKLFVAQRIYQRIDLGELSYGQPAGGGTGKNIQDCLRVMINVSDNGCGRALGAILGWGAQDQALTIEGYKQTSLATPQKTSAQDVAMLYERLYGGTLVSGTSSGKFMDLLKDQRVNNRLPIGLPSGTVIAHKTGDLDGVVHDAGIVYGPKTNYLVVVTSGSWRTPGVAPAMFADLSGQLWNFFEN